MILSEILLIVTIFSLLLLGGVSFTLFIRRSIHNSSSKAAASSEIHKKLDRIIELLEHQSK
ncbi:DUF4083 domain-containing protein [Cytobacillus spongiae]|uniref:DUF4083 family protein n=1 Tax=Cytobacillus spongiae TaxID=2901381 RepID=UPI001F30EF48|nr:DUF4083 family protein [Cytobacillus spongiae]UII54828.1 DUF4083 domain-containing protein [Cytobacillus spongiae]